MTVLGDFIAPEHPRPTEAPRTHPATTEPSSRPDSRATHTCALALNLIRKAS